MGKRTFILCEGDRGYVDRFMNYTRRRPNFLFRIQGFTGGAELASYLETDGADVGLIAWSLWIDWEESLRQRVSEMIPCLILLTEDRRSGESGLPSIYKYQSMDWMLREIMKNYEKMAQDSEKEHHTDVIGFYSPIGHCGKTTAALHLGQVLAEREGREVLYVNMEPMGGWTADVEGKLHNMSDLLYERQTEGSLNMQSLSTAWENISVLAPVVNPEDLWNLSMEERSKLLEEMRKESICDTILLDLSLDADPVPMLRCCDRTVLVRRDSMAMEKKMEAAKDYLGRRLASDEKNHLIEWCLPDFPILSRHLPGEKGELCTEMAEWIWTQWTAMPSECRSFSRRS